MFTEDQKVAFNTGYIVAMQWLTTANDLNLQLESAEDYELSEQCKESIKVDCEKFMTENGAVLQSVISPEYVYQSAGHDFYLNRNGHGAGFWDRGLGDAGEVLSEASRAFGASHEFVAEDGLIYKD